MRASVERTGVIAAPSLPSLMEEDGVDYEQPITGLEELQVGGRLLWVGRDHSGSLWQAEDTHAVQGRQS